jgi:hypothetical protein
MMSCSLATLFVSLVTLSKNDVASVMKLGSPRFSTSLWFLVSDGTSAMFARNKKGNGELNKQRSPRFFQPTSETARKSITSGRKIERKDS